MRTKVKTVETELVCPCGKRLSISVSKKGWYPSLIAVATASLWNVDEFVGVKMGKTIPAFCSHCRMEYHDAKYSEPRPGEAKGMCVKNTTPEHAHD